MALSFTAVTHVVDIGSGASLDNLTAWTVLAWVYPVSLSQDLPLTFKGDAASGSTYRSCILLSTGALYLDLHRATTDLTASSAASVYAANAWQFFGFAANSAGAATDQKIFYGTLSAAVAEVGSYASQSVGSGAVVADAAYNQGIGNGIPAQAFWGSSMRIAWVGQWNRVLTLGEIQAQQFRPHVTAGCVGFYHLGFAGTGTQPDWSGNGNAGTVTGAAVADHVPLGPLFGFDVPPAGSSVVAASVGFPFRPSHPMAHMLVR